MLYSLRHSHFDPFVNRKITRQDIRAKVWLRSRETNQFFSGNGHWVSERHHAFDFRDVQKALAYGKRSGIESLEVILETATGDFPVPVNGAGFRM